MTYVTLAFLLATVSGKPSNIFKATRFSLLPVIKGRGLSVPVALHYPFLGILSMIARIPFHIHCLVT
jgi:hypothetical protein